MATNRLDGLLLVIPLLLIIYLTMVADKRLFNHAIARLFGRRWFRIVLAAVTIMIALLFFDGQYNGLIFII